MMKFIVETMNNFLFIRQGKSNLNFRCITLWIFQIFPELLGQKKKFEIKSNNFSRGLKKIFPTIDTNHPNYALNGAFIDIKENFVNLVEPMVKEWDYTKLKLKPI